MFWEALQFSSCSPRPVMGNTLRWQVQAGELSLRTHVWSNLDPIDEAQRPEKEIALT